MNTTFLFSTSFGILWNVASIGCLVQLLRCWMGPQPSWRRALFWSVIKFGLLYAVASFFLWSERASVLGFSIGFTVTLIGACAYFAIRGRSNLATRSYVR